jgi:hypothetical protein
MAGVQCARRHVWCSSLLLQSLALPLPISMRCRLDLAVLHLPSSLVIGRTCMPTKTQAPVNLIDPTGFTRSPHYMLSVCFALLTIPIAASRLPCSFTFPTFSMYVLFYRCMFCLVHVLLYCTANRQRLFLIGASQCSSSSIPAFYHYYPLIY